MIIKQIKFITPGGKPFDELNKAIEHNMNMFYETIERFVYDKNNNYISNWRFKQMLLKMIPDQKTANRFITIANEFFVDLTDDDEGVTE